MPAKAIQAVLAELASSMLPEGATVLDPGALAAALTDWHDPYRRHRERAVAAGDRADAQDWQEALDRCEGLRHALADRIAGLVTRR